ncbi:hypothetical protein ACP4OV_018648 [Aristida adscensionis]
METRALVLVAMAMVAAVLGTAAAGTTYTVGAPDGLWDLQTNYDNWVATKTFHPGDNITFTYSAELHNVVEVGKDGYDSCNSINNVSALRTGNDVVPLTAVGTRYFLCDLTGHCQSGMKIRINVVAAAAAAPTPAAVPTSAAAAAAARRLDMLLGIAGLSVLRHALLTMW